MRAVLELKRGEIPEVILNTCFKQTQLQDTFGINMVALLDGQPRLLNLKEMLHAFLAHRREVVTRRTLYDLREARKKAHIQEGLAVALSNVDEIIELIKKSRTPAEAKVALMAKSWRSPVVEEMLKRAAAERLAARGAGREFGLQKTGYRLSDAAGAGDPRDAPRAPHGPGAGQDRRRVQAADRADRRFPGHARQTGAHHCGSSPRS